MQNIVDFVSILYGNLSACLSRLLRHLWWNQWNRFIRLLWTF